jgi:ribosomal-protein-alanine N-acetyltransferase
VPIRDRPSAEDRPGTRIRPLTADDAVALLAFERANRQWFRASVPDRGDAYFADFPARHQALLDEQAGGTARFWLVRDRDDELVGRVNLVDIANGTATLGYRIAAEHAGLGHATRAVGLVLREASAMGLGTVQASTTIDNIASQRVLTAAGFLPVDRGPATLDVNGRSLPARHFTARVTMRLP